MLDILPKTTPQQTGYLDMPLGDLILFSNKYQTPTPSMSAWLPTGQLEDGTLLFGPLNEKPNDSEPVICVTIDGRDYWVKYCLSEERLAEIQKWSEEMIRSRA